MSEILYCSSIVFTTCVKLRRKKIHRCETVKLHGCSECKKLIRRILWQCDTNYMQVQYLQFTVEFIIVLRVYVSFSCSFLIWYYKFTFMCLCVCLLYMCSPFYLWSLKCAVSSTAGRQIVSIAFWAKNRSSRDSCNPTVCNLQTQQVQVIGDKLSLELLMCLKTCFLLK